MLDGRGLTGTRAHQHSACHTTDERGNHNHPAVQHRDEHRRRGTRRGGDMTKTPPPPLPTQVPLSPPTTPDQNYISTQHQHPPHHAHTGGTYARGHALSSDGDPPRFLSPCGPFCRYSSEKLWGGSSLLKGPALQRRERRRRLPAANRKKNDGGGLKGRSADRLKGNPPGDPFRQLAVTLHNTEQESLPM